MHPFHPLDDNIGVFYDVYTTDGVLHMVQENVAVCILLAFIF